MLLFAGISLSDCKHVIEFISLKKIKGKQCYLWIVASQLTWKSLYQREKLYKIRIVFPSAPIICIFGIGIFSQI